jgi:hypothetical protein
VLFSVERDRSVCSVVSIVVVSTVVDSIVEDDEEVPLERFDRLIKNDRSIRSSKSSGNGSPGALLSTPKTKISFMSNQRRSRPKKTMLANKLNRRSGSIADLCSNHKWNNNNNQAKRRKGLFGWMDMKKESASRMSNL